MTTIKSVGIAGSGQMATGIAEVVACAGREVILRARSQQSGDRAMARIEKSLGRQVDKGSLPSDDRDEALSRIRMTTELEQLDVCELVVESVVEDLEVKKELFAALDGACRDDAILATNTSTFPVVDVAMATRRPDRVVGLHFFNPATKMSLVEVVAALTTSPETVETARSFAQEIGKDPVTVADSAGFVVNALLFPYLNAAVRMLEAGTATKEDIDTAMKGGCGFPMGPFTLLDLIGLDTSLHVLETLYEERRDPCTSPAPLLRRMVSANHLGRKTGQGFYPYPAK